MIFVYVVDALENVSQKLINDSYESQNIGDMELAIYSLQLISGKRLNFEKAYDDTGTGIINLGSFIEDSVFGDSAIVSQLKLIKKKIWRPLKNAVKKYDDIAQQYGETGLQESLIILNNVLDGKHDFNVQQDDQWYDEDDQVDQDDAKRNSNENNNKNTNVNKVKGN